MSIADASAISPMSAPAANARSDPGKDDAADRLVAVELLEPRDQLLHQRLGERVQLLGPVERDDRDRVVALDENQRLLVHGATAS